MNFPNNNGQPQMPQFDQNTMEQIQKASASLQQQLQQMNMTPVEKQRIYEQIRMIRERKD